jgi:hypothetical protein
MAASSANNRPTAAMNSTASAQEQQHRGEERCPGFAVQEHQHPDQEHEHHDEVPTFLERLTQARQLRARQSGQIVARGGGVDLHEQPEEIQERGNDRGDGDLYVGHFQEGRHDEGGGAHDRWHQHAARGGAGLDPAGIGARETGAAHGRNGHYPGGQDVGDDAAAHRAHQAAGEDRHLSRAAADVAQKREGQIEEELAAAGVLQGDAEDQEPDHQVAEGAHGDAEDALLAHGMEHRRIGQARLLAEQDAGQRLGVERVERDDRNDRQQGHAAGAPRRLQHQ